MVNTSDVTGSDKVCGQSHHRRIPICMQPLHGYSMQQSSSHSELYHRDTTHQKPQAPALHRCRSGRRFRHITVRFIVSRCLRDSVIPIEASQSMSNHRDVSIYKHACVTYLSSRPLVTDLPSFMTSSCRLTRNSALQSYDCCKRGHHSNTNDNP